MNIDETNSNKKVLAKYGDFFCAAPFTSMWEGAGGKLTTCCKSNFEVGNTNNQSYEEVVNSDYLKNLRLKILSGEKVGHCNSCWKTESLTKDIAGPRRYNNHLALDVIDEVIKEMAPDGTIINQKPVWLDLLSNNKCNFSCLGCKPEFSSTIAKNYKKEFATLHGSQLENYFPHINGVWSNNVEARVEYIIKHGDTIKQIHLNGGEPFMSEETYTLLDAMLEAGLNKKIKLWSHTNGSILKNYKGKDIVNDYFSKWGKLAKITISNDGIGKTGEFIRYGYTDRKWLEVYDKIAKSDIDDLNIQSNLSIFNIFHLKEWGKFCIDLFTKYNQNLNSISLSMWSDKTVNVRMIGICKETKQQLIEYITQLLEEQKTEITIPPVWCNTLKKLLYTIKSSEIPESWKIKALIEGIDLLDSRRNVKFAEACPELLPLYKKAKTLI